MFILHGEDSDWVHGGDERGEEERLEQAGRVVLAVDAGLAAAPQREAWTRGSGGCTVYCTVYCVLLSSVGCWEHSPIVITLKIVPTTAISNIVPR